MRGMNGRYLRHGSIVDKTAGYGKESREKITLYTVLDKMFSLPVWVWFVVEFCVLVLGSLAE